MSKIGNKPIPLTQNTTVTQDNRVAVIKGVNGELRFDIPSTIELDVQSDTVNVKRKNEKKDTIATHGLFRSILANAVTGVSEPWTRKLEIIGTGFNVKMQGEDLIFKVGYSHLVTFKKIQGVTYKVEGNNKVVVSGIDKQLVGQVAHQIKCIRKPDAYKGKGIRYENEVVRLKPGKKAKA